MKKTILLFLLSISFFLNAFTQQPTWQWAIQAGGYGDDSGTSITCDSEGNIIVCGAFNGPAYFGNYILSSNSNGCFVTKIDSAGQFLWANKITATSTSWGLSVTTDNVNNTYLTGRFAGACYVGGDTIISNGGSDFFIAKYDINGDYQWIKSGGGGGFDDISCIKYFNNNIYLGGDFNDTCLIDTAILYSIGNSDILLYRMDTDGNIKWFRQAGGGGWDVTRGMTVSNDGYIYLTGIIGQGASFADTILNVSGTIDAFIAKYDTSGNFLWAHSMGGDNNDHGISVICDSENNVYVIGLLYSTQAIFGNITVNCYGNSDYYMAKLNPEGEFLWAKTIGVRVGYTDDGWNNSLICDENNNLYITGFFRDSFVYEGFTAYSIGGYDMFVMKVDKYGAMQWIKTEGDDYSIYSRSIARDTGNNIYVTGRFYNSHIFGTDSITSLGGGEVFVARFHEEPVFIKSFPPIGGLNPKTQISIYPNPASDCIIINIPFNKNDFSQIEFYDVNGRCIKKDNLSRKSGKTKYNIRAWQKGIYIVKYSYGSNYCTGKFLKNY